MIKTPIDLEKTEAQMNMTFGEFTPVAKNLSLSIQGEMNQVQIDQEGIEASADHLSAKITIESLVINQTIIRNISGNIISIQVNATCSPIVINIPQFYAGLSGKFIQEGSNWNINLSDIALNFTSGQWNVDSISCSGLGGLDQQVTNLISDNLKDPALLQNFLKSSLAPVISQNWTEQWIGLTQSAKGSLNNIQIQQPTDNGLHILAEIPLSSSDTVELPIFDESSLSSDSPQFILSQAGFTALMKEKLMALAPQKYNLLQISGFASLMNNRLTQFLVWPDLRKFPKSNYFGLTTDLKQSTLGLTSKSNGKYDIKLKTKGNVEVNKTNKTVNYIDWTLDLQSSLNCTLKNSILTLKTGEPTTNIFWKFNQDYLNQYATNTRVSSSILTSSIKSAFTSQTATQTLPILKWQTRQWKLQSWKQTNDLITMDWVE